MLGNRLFHQSLNVYIIITLHKNKFDYKSGVPFLLPFLLFQTGHLVVVVNSSMNLL